MRVSGRSYCLLWTWSVQLQLAASLITYSTRKIHYVMVLVKIYSTIMFLHGHYISPFLDLNMKTAWFFQFLFQKTTLGISMRPRNSHCSDIYLFDNKRQLLLVFVIKDRLFYLFMYLRLKEIMNHLMDNKKMHFQLL